MKSLCPVTQHVNRQEVVERRGIVHPSAAGAESQVVRICTCRGVAAGSVSHGGFGQEHSDSDPGPAFPEPLARGAAGSLNFGAEVREMLRRLSVCYVHRAVSQ